MSTGIVFHALAALSYFGLAIFLWHALSSGKPIHSSGKLIRIGVLIALVLHGLGLHDLIIADQQLQLNWAIAMSAAVWLGIVVFWVESLVLPADGLLLLLLPAGAFTALLAALFPTAQIVAHAAEPAVRIHLLIALCAYGLVTIAALQAILMATLDRRLHHPRESIAERSPIRLAIGRMLDAQPPLLAQERLLFRVVWVAFVALGLAVVTGSMIALDLMGKWLPFDHKTIFTLLSWVTFGALLVGRHFRGWRGRIALRYTLVGFAFIVLSYTGSRFVIEVILQRS